MSVPGLNVESPKMDLLEDSGVQVDTALSQRPLPSAITAIRESVPWEENDEDFGWEHVTVPVGAMREEEEGLSLVEKHDLALQREQVGDKELLDSVLPNVHQKANERALQEQAKKIAALTDSVWRK